MLTTKCIHPGIMKALSLCGHGSKVLIADGNYPLAEKSGSAEKVYLGLTPGLPTVTDVLKTIHSVVEVEKAEVMVPGDGTTPDIFSEFEDELGLKLSGIGRFEYYDLCCQPDVVLAISTGEKRVFANILLTIGCA
ncbi:MAG: RbsD or FucU transport [Lachnospiraceae bacterium]|nr:RbsD or FucU transport [Lachnospiraceae bacterium]